MHEDIKNLLSVIITLGTDFYGGETVFKYGMTMNDMGFLFA